MGFRHGVMKKSIDMHVSVHVVEGNRCFVHGSVISQATCKRRFFDFDATEAASLVARQLFCSAVRKSTLLLSIEGPFMDAPRPRREELVY
jgi:hypothetical protein